MNKAFRGVRFSLEDHDQDDEERTRNRRTVSKKIQETAIRAITNEDMEPGSIKPVDDLEELAAGLRTLDNHVRHLRNTGSPYLYELRMHMPRKYRREP